MSRSVAGAASWKKASNGRRAAGRRALGNEGDSKAAEYGQRYRSYVVAGAYRGQWEEEMLVVVVV